VRATSRPRVGFERPVRRRGRTTRTACRPGTRPALMRGSNRRRRGGGHASADAWTGAGPAADAARDAALAAHYHGKAGEVRTLEDASDSYDDDASSPASRLANLADPDAFLAALASVYHEYA
jgi:hypothetical protein